MRFFLVFPKMKTSSKMKSFPLLLFSTFFLQFTIKHKNIVFQSHSISFQFSIYHNRVSFKRIVVWLQSSHHSFGLFLLFSCLVVIIVHQITVFIHFDIILNHLSSYHRRVTLKPNHKCLIVYTIHLPTK